MVPQKKCRRTRTLDAKGPFIIKEVYINLCLFFPFLLLKNNISLIKLGLSQTRTMNFRKETSGVSKKKLTEAMTCNSITEKETSKVSGKILKISHRLYQ